MEKLEAVPNARDLQEAGYLKEGPCEAKVASGVFVAEAASG